MFLIIAAEFLRLKSDVEKRLDDLFTRDRDLVLDEGYAGTTVISVSLAKEDDLDLEQTTVTPTDKASTLVSRNFPLWDTSPIKRLKLIHTTLLSLTFNMMDFLVHTRLVQQTFEGAETVG